MKASSLRIGNWVMVGNGDIRKVSSLSNGKTPICTLIKGCSFSESHFSESAVSPVEITKERLIDLGFKKWSTHTELYLNAGNFGIEYYDGMICLDVEGQIMILKHIKYVHELQNLYHSLTGNELTLNKPL